MSNSKPGLLSRILDRGGKPITKAAPTVLIGVIASEIVHSDFAMSLGGMCARPGAVIALSQRMTDLNFPVSVLRNDLVLDAMEMKVDRLLLLNGDMAFPPDALAQLLAWGDRDVVAGIYRNRVPPFNLIVGAKGGQKAEVSDGITEVDIVPMGFCLIKMSIFEKIGAPYFREPYAVTTPDAAGGVVPDFVDFSNRVREAGFKVWADISLSAQLGHVGKNLFMAKDEYGEARFAGNRTQP